MHAAGNYAYCKTMRRTLGLDTIPISIPRCHASAPNKETGRDNNSKNQLPIISFYNTRHFSLTFDLWAFSPFLFFFFCVFRNENSFSLVPVAHKSVAQVNHQLWNLVKTEMWRSRNVIVGGHCLKLDVEKSCCPRSYDCLRGRNNNSAIASQVF